MNPRIGSGMQQARTAMEEQAVEGVRNPEDGTRTGAGSPVPKASRGRVPEREARRRGSREWTPGRMSMEGRIFGQPQERNPTGRSGGKDQDAPGKTALRSEGPVRLQSHVGVRPGRGFLVGQAARKRRQGRGGQRRTAREPQLRSGLPPAGVIPSLSDARESRPGAHAQQGQATFASASVDPVASGRERASARCSPDRRTPYPSVRP
jgi:hypothetical protein